MTMTTVLATLESQRQIAQSQLDSILSAPCIERCNTVVVFPETGLTISTDDEGKPFICNAIVATQFFPATAKDICANVTNGRKEHPVMMSPKEYYTLQVKILTDSITLFESLPNAL